MKSFDYWLVMLTNKDMRDVLGFGRSVLDCQKTDELRHTALDLLQPMFHCDSANFFLSRPADGRLDLDHVITRSITPENLKRFRKYYYRLDPFLKNFPPRKPVITMDQVVSPTSLVRSEYYNDFLHPQAIRHQMTITAQAGKQVLGIVALFRPSSQKKFSRQEKAKAGMIATYLSGALERAILSDRDRRQIRLFETMAAQLPFEGVMLVDQSLNVLNRNPGAERILAAFQSEDTVIDESPSGLPLDVVKACREILEDRGRSRQRILNAHVKNSRHYSAAVEVRLIDGSPDSPLFFIGLNTGETHSEGIHRLKEKGISKREMEVVHQVLQGLTNNEIAQKLYISEYTVENHLKSIYRKLGVKNRTRLIRELMDLPLAVGSGR